MTSVISRLSITAVCLSTLLNASDKPLKVAAANLYASRNHTVLHDKNGFSVDGQRVSNADLSKDLRGISGKALSSLFKRNGALQVSRVGNDFRIDSRERLKGGGPISGAIAYWLTKTVCYGGMVAGMTAGTTAAVALAGPVAAPVAAGLHVASVMAPAAVAGTTVGAVGAAIGTSAVLTEAAVVAGSQLVVATGSVGGAIAAVESASTVVGGFFTALPFLP